ncbi:MAG TPA: RNB domain-containing ribonuclease [Jatrophihabitantaceae bacterium]|nr:RNB domain-containing ribonuclease [Jatrophihabitantaceae bacterium]
MASHRVAGAPLDFAALRDELEVPGDFAAPVLAEAQERAANPTLPVADATDIPFVTIDPAGSRDLDQALHIERRGTGYRVHYAIADVAAFVRPGSLLEAEARRRGETFYFPDTRVPLHPPSLSENAASLLPDQVRPAVLWQIDLEASGMVAGFDVRRARVRSRAQLDYVGVQQQLDSAAAPDAFVLLREVGERLLAIARANHAIDLDLPEQEVIADGDGAWTLTVRQPLPVEAFNAQLSILTGRCAAQLMLQHRVGLLRTVPAPDTGAIGALRRAAKALHIDWPHGAAPGDVLASVDRADPHRVAFIEHAASLLRGAGYVAFDGSLPEQTMHAGIGAPYAHVTAPLRRLVDRYATEVSLSLHAGVPVPSWTLSQLPQLPGIMRQADALAHAVDRAVVDMTEACLLQNRIGETFAATVIDADDHAATIMLDDPAVRARCSGAGLESGSRISARLDTADVAARQVHFVAA